MAKSFLKTLCLIGMVMLNFPGLAFASKCGENPFSAPGKGIGGAIFPSLRGQSNWKEIVAQEAAKATESAKTNACTDAKKNLWNLTLHEWCPLECPILTLSKTDCSITGPVEPNGETNNPVEGFPGVGCDSKNDKGWFEACVGHLMSGSLFSRDLAETKCKETFLRGHLNCWVSKKAEAVATITHTCSGRLDTAETLSTRE